MHFTHPKFKKMMALLTKTGQQGFRHTHAWDISQGTTESTRDLTESETDLLIERLEKMFKGMDVCDKMRKKLISMAREMGWEVPHPYGWGKAKADMDRVNDWCVKYGQYHKRLNEHTENELPMLISQFEQVYKSFLSS